MNETQKQEVKPQEGKILELKPENIFTFPDGLPGFEKVKKFVILVNKEDAPFGRLAAVDHDLCFFVVDPWVLYPDYKPDIDEEDLKKVGISARENTLILAIVNIPVGKPESSTMNLTAPLLINSQQGLGKQVIINNYKDFNSRHPVWQKEEETDNEKSNTGNEIQS